MYDIKIKNARIRGRKDGLFDIRVRGKIGWVKHSDSECIQRELFCTADPYFW